MSMGGTESTPRVSQSESRPHTLDVWQQHRLVCRPQPRIISACPAGVLRQAEIPARYRGAFPYPGTVAQGLTIRPWTPPSFTDSRGPRAEESRSGGSRTRNTCARHAFTDRRETIDIGAYLSGDTCSVLTRIKHRLLRRAPHDHDQLRSAPSSSRGLVHGLAPSSVVGSRLQGGRYAVQRKRVVRAAHRLKRALPYRPRPEGRSAAERRRGDRAPGGRKPRARPPPSVAIWQFGVSMN
jgi:hypothetical protein